MAALKRQSAFNLFIYFCVSGFRKEDQNSRIHTRKLCTNPVCTGKARVQIKRDDIGPKSFASFLISKWSGVLLPRDPIAICRHHVTLESNREISCDKVQYNTLYTKGNLGVLSRKMTAGFYESGLRRIDLSH